MLHLKLVNGHFLAEFRDGAVKEDYVLHAATGRARSAKPPKGSLAQKPARVARQQALLRSS